MKKIRVLVLTLFILNLNLFGLSLSERSPFIWDGFNTKSNAPITQNKPTSNTQFEFSGVYSVGSKYFVLINELRKSGQWYEVPSESDSLAIKSFNPDEASVLIETKNKPTWLQLKELSKNSNPLPVQGQNTATSAREKISTSRPSVSVGSTVRKNTRRVVRPSQSNGKSSTSTSSARRIRSSKRNSAPVAESAVSVPPSAMVKNRAAVPQPSYLSDRPDSRPPRDKPQIDTSILNQEKLSP